MRSYFNLLFRSFLVIASLVISVSSSHAAESKPESEPLYMLENPAEFRFWLAKRVHYICDDTALLKQMRTNIPNVLFYGLNQIKQINPELVDFKTYWHERFKINFRCVEDSFDPALKDRFVPDHYPLDWLNIFREQHGENIFVSRSLISKIDMSHYLGRNPNAYTWSFSQDDYPLGDQHLQKAKSDPFLKERQTLFVAYLQARDYETIPRSTVNYLPQNMDRIPISHRLSYNCAEVAYPFLSRGQRHGAPFDLQNACAFCAMAEYNFRDTKINFNLSGKAQLLCH